MHDIIDVFTEIIQTHLAAHAINAELVNQITDNITKDLFAKFSGRHIYFKTNAAQKRAERNHQIASEYTGNNFDELCQKYQLTEYWLRKILADADAKANEAVG